MGLYSDVKETGGYIANHASDLYIEANDVNADLIKSMAFARGHLRQPSHGQGLLRHPVRLRSLLGCRQGRIGPADGPLTHDSRTVFSRTTPGTDPMRSQRELHRAERARYNLTHPTLGTISGGRARELWAARERWDNVVRPTADEDTIICFLWEQTTRLVVVDGRLLRLPQSRARLTRPRKGHSGGPVADTTRPGRYRTPVTRHSTLETSMTILYETIGRVESFRLSPAPLPDPVDSLPWRVRPIARFLRKPTWTVEGLERVRRFSERSGLLTDDVGLDDLISALDENEEVKEFARMARRGLDSFPTAPNPDNVRPLSPVSRSRPKPVKPAHDPRPVGAIVAEAVEAIRVDREALSGEKMGRYRGYTITAGEVFEGTTTAERAAITRTLNAIGYAKDHACSRPRHRFAAFALDCLEGSTVTFSAPEPSDPAPSAPEATDTAPRRPAGMDRD